MQILFIGDIVGSGGRRLLRQVLPEIRQQHQIDLCLANVENAAAGMGLTAALAQEIRDAGVDLMTLGRGHLTLNHPLGQVLLINLQGRVFMDPLDDPFAAVDRVLEGAGDHEPGRIVIVDFHAEATSEKNAMAWYLDGRATLVVGTHTHVQTADERILEHGTAFITDVGMTGPVNGVIGMDKATSLRRFVDHLPSRYQMAQGLSALCAVVVDADEKTGRVRRIERIRIEE